MLHDLSDDGGFVALTTLSYLFINSCKSDNKAHRNMIKYVILHTQCSITMTGLLNNNLIKKALMRPLLCKHCAMAVVR